MLQKCMFFLIALLEKKNSLQTKNKVVDGKTPGQNGNLKQRRTFLEHPNKRFGPSCFVRAFL